MSETPPGGDAPGPPDDPRRDGSDESPEDQEPSTMPDQQNPFAAIFGGVDPADMGSAFARIGELLSWQGGPVNWDLASQVARQTISAGGDRSVGAADGRAIADAVRLADHWLDSVTTLPAAAAADALAWSRAEWFEETLPVWKRLVEPVATHVVDAIGGAMPSEVASLSGPMLAMMRQVGGAMFGAQVGQALGSLAGEVVGSADIGLPLTANPRAALLPANVAAFGSGLSVARDDVRLYLALREAAYVRLFAHVPWLGPRLIGAVEQYGDEITIDTSRIEEAMREIDPGRPEALGEIFEAGLFSPAPTTSQQSALARIETLLALVEGWVDAVVTAATTERMPAAAALQEAVRRRRASGGPAEQTFATLVGLELRPRRLRDAARLWSLLADARGLAGRDAVWAHPDLLPSSADLDDPDAFVHGEPGLSDDDLDAFRAAAEADGESDSGTDGEVSRETGGETGGEQESEPDDLEPPAGVV